jgi:hypothetical protein
MAFHRSIAFGVAFHLMAVLLHANGPESKVRILVLNSSGGPVSETAKVQIKGGGVSKSVNVQGIGFVNLPQGEYMFEYSALSYASGSRCVSVKSANMDVLLGLAMRTPDQLIGEGPIQPWVVSGVVRPRPDGLSVVRLIGLYSGTAVESAIDQQGVFSLEVFPQGKYLLVLVSGGSIVYQRQLAIDINVSKLLNLGTLAPR